MLNCSNGGSCDIVALLQPDSDGYPAGFFLPNLLGDGLTIILTPEAMINQPTFAAPPSEMLFRYRSSTFEQGRDLHYSYSQGLHHFSGANEFSLRLPTNGLVPGSYENLTTAEAATGTTFGATLTTSLGCAGPTSLSVTVSEIETAGEFIVRFLATVVRTCYGIEDLGGVVVYQTNTPHHIGLGSLTGMTYQYPQRSLNRSRCSFAFKEPARSNTVQGILLARALISALAPIAVRALWCLTEPHAMSP